MSERNKSVARRAMQDVWNQESAAAADELYARDYIAHTEDGDLHGPRQFMQYLSEFRQSFPDIEFKIEDVIGEGDRVAVRWRSRGTHTGTFQGLPSTGKQCVATGITLFRIAGGKIVEDWGNWDRQGLMQQLGVIPA
jgi:steroid delta-isomerase-like uncharacterized protein